MFCNPFSCWNDITAEYFCRAYHPYNLLRHLAFPRLLLRFLNHSNSNCRHTEPLKETPKAYIQICHSACPENILALTLLQLCTIWHTGKAVLFSKISCFVWFAVPLVHKRGLFCCCHFDLRGWHFGHGFDTPSKFWGVKDAEFWIFPDLWMPFLLIGEWLD